MKIKYSIKGLACPNCASKLSALIAEETGATVKINFLTETLTLDATEDTPALHEAVLRISADFSKDVAVERLA